MVKVNFSSEVQLLSLISIKSAPRMLDFRLDFQSFSQSVITFDGQGYNFIDSSINELHSRQAQFSTMPQTMRVRNAPISSQRNDVKLPGLTTEFDYNFSLETPLDLVKRFDGLRRCSVQINYVYRDANSALILDRFGRAEVVESVIKGSELIFHLNTVLTPTRPVGLVRTR